MGDDADKQRLYWRCRRGMLELDELLQDFVAREYARLDVREQQAFHALLCLPDQELLACLLQQQTPTDGELVHVITRIRQSYQP